MKRALHALVVLSITMTACAGPAEEEAPMTPEAPPATVTRAPFAALPDGRQVELFTLTNATGIEVRVIEYGGIVLSLSTPDRDGDFGDIVLGYADLDGYLEETPYFGALIGRYGNRIGGARFTLDDVEYPLAANNGPNHLHGGEIGYDKVLWSGTPIERSGTRRSGLQRLFSKTFGNTASG